MKRKRSLFKTIGLMMIRYYRWKQNPKNLEDYIRINYFRIGSNLF